MGFNLIDNDESNFRNSNEDKNKVYGYLLNMNILTFSEEKLINLKNEMEKVKEKLKRLEVSSIEDLWLADIEKFE